MEDSRPPCGLPVAMGSGCVWGSSPALYGWPGCPRAPSSDCAPSPAAATAWVQLGRLPLGSFDTPPSPCRTDAKTPKALGGGGLSAPGP